MRPARRLILKDVGSKSWKLPQRVVGSTPQRHTYMYPVSSECISRRHSRRHSRHNPVRSGARK